MKPFGENLIDQSQKHQQRGFHPFVKAEQQQVLHPTAAGELQIPVVPEHLLLQTIPYNILQYCYWYAQTCLAQKMENLAQNSNDQLLHSELVDRIGSKPEKKTTGNRKGFNTGHWSAEEHALYMKFLSTHKDVMESPELKKSNKIFKLMSEIIMTRSPSNSIRTRRKLTTSSGEQNWMVSDQIYVCVLLINNLMGSCVVNTVKVEQEVTYEHTRTHAKVSKVDSLHPLRLVPRALPLSEILSSPSFHDKADAPLSFATQPDFRAFLLSNPHSTAYSRRLLPWREFKEFKSLLQGLLATCLPFALPIMCWKRVSKLAVELYTPFAAEDSVPVEHQEVFSILPTLNRIDQLQPVRRDYQLIFLCFSGPDRASLVTEQHPSVTQWVSYEQLRQEGTSPKAGQVVALKCQVSWDFEGGLREVVSDFKEGLVLLSYALLKQHLKRRQLRQHHLWALLGQVNENTKPLVAASIFVNYLAKMNGNLNELLKMIVRQKRTLDCTYDRIRCVQELHLSGEEQSYLMSGGIVEEVIERSLTHSQILIRCIEQKFGVQFQQKIKESQDSHYFLSYRFLNASSIVEIYFQQKNKYELQDLVTEKMRFYSQIAQLDQNNKELELFIPHTFYTPNHSKYYFPQRLELNQLLVDQDTPRPPQDTNRLVLIKMVLNMELLPLSTPPTPAQLILWHLIQAYLLEQQNSVEHYRKLYLLLKRFFGHPRTRGTLRHPLLPFVLHRLSVFANQAANHAHAQEVLALFLDYEDSFVLPCNDIFVHQSYHQKDLNSVVKASLQAYSIQAWLVTRYNELIELDLTEVPEEATFQPGQLVMFGLNQHYQLAQPFTIKYAFPKAITSSVIFRRVACGHKHTLALSVSGQVYCWGNNEYGKCGVSAGQKFVRAPTKLIMCGQIAVYIDCGHDHSLFLNAQGQVFTWGCGEGGLLGNGQLANSEVPQLVQLPQVAMVRCGGLHTAAVSGGAVYTWGRGEGGQLGTKGDMSGGLSVPHKLTLEGVIQVGCGDAHTVALNWKGELYGWGYNEQGQLGLDRNIVSVCEPQLMRENVEQVYCGSLQTYYVREQGLYGLGLNDYGQLNGEEDKLITKGAIEELSVGQDHTLVLQNEQVYGWGLNKFGVLGSAEGDQVRLKNLLNDRCSSISGGGFHSGLVIKGSDHYFSFDNQFDYRIE